MARWRPLPESMPVAARVVVTELRMLKDRSGLTLAALAARTACSTSAWSRYLNGQVLIPRDIARALATLAAGDQQRLMALWENAAAAWAPASATEPSSVPPSAPPPPVPQYRSQRPAADAADGPDHPDPGTAPATGSAGVADRGLPAHVAGAAPAGHHGHGRVGRVLTATAIAMALLAVCTSAESSIPGIGSAADVRGDSAPRASREPATVPAVASPGCRLSTCADQQPAVMACDRDARTLTTAPLGAASLSLRFSPACQASWAHLRGARRYDRLALSTRSAALLKHKARSDGDITTAMLPAELTTMACAELINGLRHCLTATPATGAG
ncbi:helix-turn-helix domain-containing protein [Spirillospora sp. NPDC047279]|uniref:helix-turn-helix domain-containing protein n=1 Tax=Spirillospora sp. NPDC047279 TaxID=3155478 RepID=UPI0033D46052